MKIKVCKTCHCPIPMPWYGCAVCNAGKGRLDMGGRQLTEAQKAGARRETMRSGDWPAGALVAA